jgi:hypothetical protein
MGVWLIAVTKPAAGTKHQYDNISKISQIWERTHRPDNADEKSEHSTPIDAKRIPIDTILAE